MTPSPFALALLALRQSRPPATTTGGPHMGQIEAARRIGTTQSQYCLWEQGHVIPTRASLDRIVTGLRLTDPEALRLKKAWWLAYEARINAGTPEAKPRRGKILRNLPART